MTYATCCSGIEAVSVAVEPLGWRAAWFSEIDPFCCALLATKYPGVRNVGDMTKVTESDLERCDVLVAGTPCQSFSVAGLRGGLADARGNLALRFFQIAGVVRPRWVVWENVPGCLSSDGGRDFGAILGALGELGYGFAYRVLDAQFVRVDGYRRAVPQRRRRVFVVGCLGDWRRAAAVLFDSESLYGNSPPRRTTGERVARDTAPSIGASGRGFSRAGETRGQDCVVPVLSAPEISPAMKSRDSKGVSSDGDGDGLPLVVAHSLKAEGHDASEDGTGRGVPLVFAQNQRDEVRLMDAAGALAAEPGMKQQTYVAQPPIAFQTRIGRNGRGQPKDVVGALTSCAAGTHADSKPHVAYRSGVRRLTPRECERLQGFPTTLNRAIIRAWFDDDGTRCVRAEVRFLSAQSNALPAAAVEKRDSACLADVTFWNDQVAREATVAVHVRQSHAARVERISSRGRSIWSASGAEAASSYPLSTRPDDTALVIAQLAQSLAQTTTHGRVELPASISGSIARENGNWRAVTFGQESEVIARDVASGQIAAMKSIIGSRGHDIPLSDWIAKISLCYAATATISCIPRKTLAANFCDLVIDHEIDYSLIEYRKKPAADAPRYKSLGNSMAVNVMRWILQRILNEP